MPIIHLSDLIVYSIFAQCMIKLHHIAMYVIDLDGAKAFFQKYFDALPNKLYHNSKTGLRTYFLSFPDGGELEIMQHPQVQISNNPIHRSGLIHLAVKVGSREKVNLLTARFAEDGYKILSGPRITGDGYYESSIIGFEGNLIEIIE